MTAVISEGLDFSQISLNQLSAISALELDRLPFGVVGLSTDNLVQVYNRTESQLAGLPTSTVIGNDFFISIAQCMNNFMVAQRFQDEAELDTELPYVLTFRMRPTRVRLRLLQGAVPLKYILIQR
jgi:photoactive yellow protein